MNRWLLHVAAPLTVGAAMYVLFRDTRLVVFDWLNALGLAGEVQQARAVAQDALNIPHAVLVTLPDGLWVYAGTAWLCQVWNSGINGWTVMPTLLGVFSELGQLCGLIPGTFDLADLVLVSIAGPVAWYASKPHIQHDPQSPSPHFRVRRSSPRFPRNGK